MSERDLKINVLFQDTGVIYNEMKKVTELHPDGVDIEDLKDSIVDSIRDNSEVDAENSVIYIKY